MRAEIQIDVKKFQENIQAIKNHLLPKTKFLLVIKGNAYGHGAKELCQYADVDYFGVATEDEGVQLRQEGVDLPILVMGPPTDYQKAYDYNLTLTIFHTDHLKNIQKPIKAHIKVDTGLNRIGIQPRDTGIFIDKCTQIQNLTIEGIYTHLATSEYGLGIDKHMKDQQSWFSFALNGLDRSLLRHIMNTGGAIKDPENAHDMVRIGIGAYGYEPTNRLGLKPILTLKSKVAFAKFVDEDSYIGYQAKYKTTSHERIVTIPIGWGDGFFDGKVLINGVECPIIDICMDQTILSAAGSGAQIGDDVVIYPNNIKKFLGCLRHRIPRIYVGG
jgi:alanine racemase